METKLVAPNSYTRIIECTYSKEEVEKKINEKYELYRKSVALPGFRVGHVPMGLLKTNFGDIIKNEVAEELVADGIKEALEKEGLNPINKGKIEYTNEVDENSSFSFKYEFEIMPEVKLTNYKGYKLTKRIKTVQDSDVENEIKNLKVRFSSYKPVKRKVKKDDIVSFNYKTKDNKSLRLSLLVSEPENVGGVSGFLGMEIGEKKDLNLRFPDDSRSELAGKELIGEAEVIDVAERVLPSDEELLEQLGRFKTMDELKEAVREELKKNAERESEERLEDELFDNLLRDNPIEVPKSIIRQVLVETIRSTYGEKELQKLSEPQLEELEKKYYSILERAAAKRIMLDAIIKTEKIELDDEDYSKLSESMGADKQTIRSLIETNENFENIKQNLLRQKAIKLLLSYSYVTETKE